MKCKWTQYTQLSCISWFTSADTYQGEGVLPILTRAWTSRQLAMVKLTDGRGGHTDLVEDEDELLAVRRGGGGIPILLRMRTSFLLSGGGDIPILLRMRTSFLLSGGGGDIPILFRMRTSFLLSVGGGVYRSCWGWGQASCCQEGGGHTDLVEDEDKLLAGSSWQHGFFHLRTSAAEWIARVQHLHDYVCLLHHLSCKKRHNFSDNEQICQHFI